MVQTCHKWGQGQKTFKSFWIGFLTQLSAATTHSWGWKLKAFKYKERWTTEKLAHKPKDKHKVDWWWDTNKWGVVSVASHERVLLLWVRGTKWEHASLTFLPRYLWTENSLSGFGICALILLSTSLVVVQCLATPPLLTVRRYWVFRPSCEAFTCSPRLCVGQLWKPCVPRTANQRHARLNGYCTGLVCLLCTFVWSPNTPPPFGRTVCQMVHSLAQNQLRIYSECQLNWYTTHFSKS